MDTWLIDAVHQFMQSTTLTKFVDSFVRSNCDIFLSLEHNLNTEGKKQMQDFSHTHYDIWRQYQREAEEIIECALSQVGCCIEQFVKVCDEIIALKPEQGPRDVRLKIILSDFLTFNEFSAFSSMMQRRGREMYGNESFKNKNHLERKYEKTNHRNKRRKRTKKTVDDFSENDLVASTEAGLLFDMIACAKVPQAVEAIIELLLKERGVAQDKLTLAKIDGNGNTLGMAACAFSL